MDQAQAVQNIIVEVTKTIGIIASLAGLGTFGVTEFAKKVGLSSRWAGVFAYVFGFFISILVCGLARGHYFDAFSILVGVMVAFGVPGIYSGVRAAVTKPVE